MKTSKKRITFEVDESDLERIDFFIKYFPEYKTRAGFFKSLLEYQYDLLECKLIKRYSLDDSAKIFKEYIKIKGVKE
jgi:hypothetical protein